MAFAIVLRPGDQDPDDDALGGRVDADLAMRVDRVVHRVIPRPQRDLFVAQGARGGAVQHDVLVNGEDVGLVRRLGQKVQLQPPVDPGGPGRDGPGAGSGGGILEPNHQAGAKVIHAIILCARDLNSHHDAHRRRVWADVPKRVDRVIHRVISGVKREVFIAQRLRGRAVQHDVLVNGENVGLVRRLGQKVQLQSPIHPGGSGRDHASSGRRIGRQVGQDD